VAHLRARCGQRLRGVAAAAGKSDNAARTERIPAARTQLADSRSTELQLVGLRRAKPRRNAVFVTHRVLTRLTKEVTCD